MFSYRAIFENYTLETAEEAHINELIKYLGN